MEPRRRPSCPWQFIGRSIGRNIGRRAARAGLLAGLVASSAYGGKHGFADKPHGGATDPRIEVLASTGAPGIALQPTDADYAPCGAYLYEAADASSGHMTVAPLPTLPETLPLSHDPTLHNAWIALRFPFKISSDKVRNTIFQSTSLGIPNSFLQSTISVVDENGAHVPVTATVGGVDAFGLNRFADAGFPQLMDGPKNVLAGKDTLLLIAEEGDNDLSTAANFGPDPLVPALSLIHEIHIAIESLGGITMHAEFEVRIGNLGTANLSVVGVEATHPKSPAEFDDDGNLVVESNSDFRIRFNHPIDPASAGISKAVAKSLGIPWQKNLAITTSPCSATSAFPSGDPIAPNLLFTELTTQETLAFDIRPVNPNNLAEYVISPLKKLKPGVYEVRALGIDTHTVVTNQISVSSAPTTQYGDILATDAFLSFAVK